MGRLMAVLMVVFLFANTAMAEEKKPEGTPAKKAGTRLDVKKAKQPVPNEEALGKHKDLIKAYQDYWQALMKKDLKAAYEMEASEFKKKVSYDLYEEKHKKMITLLGVKPMDIKQTDGGEVVVRGVQAYRMRANLDSARFFDDVWIKEGDVYKHLKTEMKKASDLKKVDIKADTKKAAETPKADDTKKAAETKEVVK